MTRIRLSLFSDPLFLLSCQSSLHFLLPVRLHSWVLCASTHVFDRLLLSDPAPSCHPFYALVFCSTDYSSKSVTSLQYLLWAQLVLPNAMFEVLGIKGIVLIFTHLEPPSLQEPYIFLRLFLLQAIFGCKCCHKLNFTLFAVPVYLRQLPNSHLWYL